MMICVSNPGPAIPLGMGSEGRSAIIILGPLLFSFGKRYLGRTILLTINAPGVYSKISVISSPIFFAHAGFSIGSITSS